MKIKKDNIVTLDDLLAAREKFPEGYIRPVSVKYCAELSKFIGGELYIVRADQGDVLSFKERGAFVKVAKELERAIEEGRNKLRFVAASEGNHSQGVAKAVAYFSELYTEMDIKATIIMPELTPQVKQNRTIAVGKGYTDIKPVKQDKEWGDASGLYDDALAMAKEMESKEDFILVPTFDGKEIVAGAGTTGLEMQEMLDDVSEIHLAAGGAGFMAGLSVAYSNTDTKIIGVQPSWVPSAVASIANGNPIRIPEISGAKKLKLDNKELDYEIHPDGVIIAEIGEVPIHNVVKYGASVATVTPEQTAFGYAHFMNAFCKDNSEIDFDSAPEVCATLGLANVLRESARNPGCYKDKKIAVIVSGRNIELEEAKGAYEAGRIVADYTKISLNNVSEIFDAPTPVYEKAPQDQIKALHSLKGHVSERFYAELQSRGLTT